MARKQREIDEARERAVTFEAVAEDFIAEALAGKRARRGRRTRDQARDHPRLGQAADGQYHPR